MRILHLASTFFPVVGGTATRLYSEMRNTNNDYYLYVPYTEDSKDSKQVEQFHNITIHRYNLKSDSKFRIPFISFFRKIIKDSKEIPKIIKEKYIDIVYGHNPLVNWLASMKYAKKCDIPLIIEIHMFDLDIPKDKRRWYVPKFIYKVIRWIYKRNEKKCFKFADIILIGTERVKDRVVKYYNIGLDKIFVLDAGVDIEKFKPNLQNLEIIKKQKNIITFAYTGYLKNYNGIELLLETFISLPNNIKYRIKLIIVGQGPLLDYVKNISNKYKNLIQYHDTIDYDKMVEFYSMIDVAIVPRLNLRGAGIGTPIKLLEAMSMEKIVLASDVSGHRAVINHNKSGILFESSNLQDFKEKVVFIVNNFEDINIGKRAREEVIKNHSLQSMDIKLNNLYLELKLNNLYFKLKNNNK